MTNMLDSGYGGLVAPSPADDKANTASQVQSSEAGGNPIGAKSASRPPSPNMTHFGGKVDTIRALFNKMKEAQTQASAIKTEMTQLADMGDTVTTKDVVKGFAGIVASGVPAVACATILADMPEQSQQLQGWVKQKFGEAISADQKVNQLLGQARHQMLVAGLQHTITHSAEAHAAAQQRHQLATQPVAGRA